LGAKERGKKYKARVEPDDEELKGRCEEKEKLNLKLIR
jgi:hypothetical protein